MYEMDKDLEELIFSDNSKYDGTESIAVHLKDIDDSIRDLQEEIGKCSEPDIALNITLRSLMQLREGYLALAKEEGEDVLSVPEIRQWASNTKEREPEMAAVEA